MMVPYTMSDVFDDLSTVGNLLVGIGLGMLVFKFFIG